MLGGSNESLFARFYIQLLDICKHFLIVRAFRSFLQCNNHYYFFILGMDSCVIDWPNKLMGGGGPFL